MGFLDKAKNMAGDAADKASDLKDQVPTDKVDEAVDAVKDKIPGADKIPGIGGSEQAAEPSQPADRPAADQQRGDNVAGGPAQGKGGGQGERRAEGGQGERRAEGGGQGKGKGKGGGQGQGHRAADGPRQGKGEGKGQGKGKHRA